MVWWKWLFVFGFRCYVLVYEFGKLFNIFEVYLICFLKSDMSIFFFQIYCLKVFLNFYNRVYFGLYQLVREIEIIREEVFLFQSVYFELF